MKTRIEKVYCPAENCFYYYPQYEYTGTTFLNEQYPVEIKVFGITLKGVAYNNVIHKDYKEWRGFDGYHNGECFDVRFKTQKEAEAYLKNRDTEPEVVWESEDV